MTREAFLSVSCCATAIQHDKKRGVLWLHHCLQAIAAGATAATRSYTNFINSFRRDDTGELPDRIDQDNEHFFLMAAFNLGRVLHRCALRMDQSTNDRWGFAVLQSTRVPSQSFRQWQNIMAHIPPWLHVYILNFAKLCGCTGSKHWSQPSWHCCMISSILMRLHSCTSSSLKSSNI